MLGPDSRPCNRIAKNVVPVGMLRCAVAMLSCFGAVPLLASDMAVAQTGSAQADHIEKFSFPGKVNGFERVNQTDASLTGIFARGEYRKSIPGGKISIIADIVHLLDMSPKVHFAIRKAALNQQFAGLVAKKEGEYKMPNLPAQSGYYGRFERVGPHGTESIGVWTFDFGSWDVYIKARFPTKSAKKSEAEVGRMLKSLNWELLANTRPEDSVDGEQVSSAD